MKNKSQELLSYLIFGVLTTLVNFIAFYLTSKLFGENLYLVNNAIAWLIAVIFAFFTNKLFVFKSKSFEPLLFVKEFIEFFAARIFSFALEEGGLFLFIRFLDFNEKSLEIFNVTVSGQMIAKVILAIIVVIMNYFFSKFIIFSKKDSK